MSRREIRPRSSSIDHDDSTDDEKVTKGVADYEIVKAADKFVEMGWVKGGTYGNPEDLKFAFALHAFGRSIYFSEPVNAIYEARGGLKESHLKSDGEEIRKTTNHAKFPIEDESFGSELSYIAHRRFTDRSIKRHSKNKRGDANASVVSQDTTFTFFDGAESKEKKTFTPNNKRYGSTVYHGTRSDWIELNQRGEDIPYLRNGRATTTVIGIIESLKGEMNDQEIAKNIRLTLKGGDTGSSPEAKKKLAFLTNLMFGAEASRNPACYVSSQIFLDLIENSYSSYETWQAAFEEGRFPMMIKDAVAASRRINDLLNDEEVMPHDYHYDYGASHNITTRFGGATESPSQKANKNAKTILQQEVRLAKDWLDLSGVEESFEGLVVLLSGRVADWYSDVDLSHFSNLEFGEESQEKEQGSKVNLSADFADEKDDSKEERRKVDAVADVKRRPESPETSFKPEAKKSKKFLEKTGGRGIGGEGSDDDS